MFQEIMNSGGLSLEQAKVVDDALRPPMPPGGPRGKLPPRE